MDELHWIGKNRMVCTRPECQEQFRKIMESMDAVEKLQKCNSLSRREYYGIPMSERPDWDFLPFHCACHDISLGKTSFPCADCSIWVCQNCAKCHQSETYCGACLEKKKAKKRKVTQGN